MKLSKIFNNMLLASLLTSTSLATSGKEEADEPNSPVKISSPKTPEDKSIQAPPQAPKKRTRRLNDSGENLRPIKRSLKFTFDRIADTPSKSTDEPSIFNLDSVYSRVNHNKPKLQTKDLGDDLANALSNDRSENAICPKFPFHFTSTNITKEIYLVLELFYFAKKPNDNFGQITAAYAYPNIPLSDEEADELFVFYNTEINFSHVENNKIQLCIRKPLQEQDQENIIENELFALRGTYEKRFGNEFKITNLEIGVDDLNSWIPLY